MVSVKRTVKRVVDGDTVEVNRRIGDTRFVRLAGVDAPEKDELGGQRAANILRGMIGGEPIRVTPVGRSYGRIVGVVRHERRNINKRMKEKLKRG